MSEITEKVKLIIKISLIDDTKVGFNVIYLNDHYFKNRTNRNYFINTKDDFAIFQSADKLMVFEKTILLPQEIEKYKLDMIILDCKKEEVRKKMLKNLYRTLILWSASYIWEDGKNFSVKPKIKFFNKNWMIF